MQFWPTSESNGRVEGTGEGGKTKSAGRKWVRFQRWLLSEVKGKTPVGGEKERDIKKRDGRLKKSGACSETRECKNIK